MQMLSGPHPALSHSAITLKPDPSGFEVQRDESHKMTNQEH
jgi:hypothetical protein